VGAGRFDENLLAISLSVAASTGYGSICSGDERRGDFASRIENFFVKQQRKAREAVASAENKMRELEQESERLWEELSRIGRKNGSR
jgi:hypothetical protein